VSVFVDWIAAQGDEAGGKNESHPLSSQRAGMQRVGGVGWKQLSPRDFSPSHHSAQTRAEYNPLDQNPDLWLYRDRTVALLRRYMRFSLETGRLPSMVGREFFRAKITAYPAATFEDRVIFVRDVEKCLDRLESWDRQLIARVVLQEHSHERAAYLLHCSRKTIQRRIVEVIDLLSEDFLRVGLLAAQPDVSET
jgi:hypothetical protein